MLHLVLTTFLLALICPLLCQYHRKFIGWALALLPFALFVLFIAQIPGILHGDTISSSLPWLATLKIKLSFYLDGLSLLFCLLITGIGTLIIIYSGFYLKGHRQLGLYYTYLFFFMGAMLGTVLSSNLITLFIFWELTSLSSYLLISFNHQNKGSRRAALQGLLVTASGGLLMLVSFIMIGSITHHYALTTLFNEHKMLTSSAYYPVLVILLLIGAFTKSAQYPFHFWLPNAMQAPTPVSAYLHSATMVKLGVYLVARMLPILGHTALWTALLTSFGSATMICAAILALRVTDLKLLLAYSTVMALGALMFLLASGKPETIEAAMVFLLAHALYKGALFLTVGNIDHATGTRELPQLHGLAKYMPITFAAVILSAISMAGLPPVLGFISKEIIYGAKLAEPNFAWTLTSIAFLTNVVFVVIALLVVIKPFLTAKTTIANNTFQQAHEAGFASWLPPLLLGCLGLLFGLYPSLIDKNLITPATSSILQQSNTVTLNLWHGVTPAVLLSSLTFLVAAGIYFIYPTINRFLKKATWLNRFSPENCYQISLRLFNSIAANITHIIQPGLLRIYTAVTFIVMAALTLGTFYYFKHVPAAHWLPNAPWFDWLIAIVMAIAAIATLVTSSYLASLAFLSIIGIGSTLVFLLYSAPDVAMTQLLVDVLTIVIVVLALYRLQSLPSYEKLRRRAFFFNLIISLAVGIAVTLILLSIISIPLNLYVNNYFAAHSLPMAHGRNIVNVILVDFRSFDTLGEVIVVAIAGLGVYGLLKFNSEKKGPQ